MEWQGLGFTASQSVRGGSREETGHLALAPSQQRPRVGGSPGQGRGVRKASEAPSLWKPRSPAPPDACLPPDLSILPLTLNPASISPAVLPGDSQGMLTEHEISPCSSSRKSFLKAAFWRVATLSLGLHGGGGPALSCRLRDPASPGLPVFQHRLRSPVTAPHCGGKLSPWPLLSVQGMGMSWGPRGASLGESGS